MKATRLLLVVLTLAIGAACSTDITGPQTAQPASYGTGMLGSGY